MKKSLEKIRERLNYLILTNADKEDILSLSQDLDKLILEYYKLNKN